MLKIEIWSDFSCPFCYIGKTRLESVIANHFSKEKIEIEMKSYQLNPNAPLVAEYDAYTYFAKMKGVSLNESKEMFKYTIDAAKSVGLNFDYNSMKMTNTIKAHKVAKYARTKGLENVISKKLMEGYFERGLDINSDQVLLKIGTDLGLEFTELTKVISSDLYLDIVMKEINEAESFGISSVPYFVLNRKYAISGAQPESVFINALNHVLKEEKDFQNIGLNNDSCGIDGC